jgi:predicted RNase H-like nuclease (RuvC/YqgF family)
MAKENDCAECDKVDIATLKTELAEQKKKNDEFTTQNKDLQAKLDEATKVAKAATDSLNQYRDAEKKALADSIIKRTDFKAEDLKDKSVEDLRNIHSALDHAKVDGTVKPVRGTGADNKVEVDLRKPNDAILSIGRPERQADGSIKWVVPE